MGHMKLEGRHDVFTPRHEALVFEKPITAERQPNLFT